MAKPAYNVLFLCTANSARSIMAEAVLNTLGGGRFRAFSAGSHAAGRVHPLALEVLAKAGYSTAGLHSKDWGEFARSRAPRLDFVITVCDNAAGEACPIFRGVPLTAHWSIPDPAAAEGTDAEKRRAFREALRMLARRVQRFTSLPFDSVDKEALRGSIEEIGAN